MILSFILWICGLHWFADFFCQSHQMSVNKSHSFEWLTKHVAVYTMLIWVGFASYFLMFHSPHPLTGDRIFAFVTLNGLLHWITDFFTSKINAKLWVSGMNPVTGKEKSLHWFFVAVGADQFIHYATLFVTAQYILFNSASHI